jgi:hypothetical protein
MPTPRFRDLSPEAAASVVDAFLGGETTAEFTEKMAGQHLTAIVKPDGSVDYAIKTGSPTGGGGYFPDLEEALERHHPPVKKTVRYQFEVLKKSKRPDYIDYPLSAAVTAVEYGGVMSKAVADALNAAQTSVVFYTKDSIRKAVGGIVSDPETKKILKSFRRKAASGSATKAETLEVEELLMDLVDSGKIPPTLGGSRMEGLFGTVTGGRGFKIPSRSYADLQLRQAKFYAIVRADRERETIARFKTAAADPSSDKAVSDVLEYIDYMSSGGPGPGFKVFFTHAEIDSLKTLADSYRGGNAAAGKKLAADFFKRVANRTAWVSSGVQEVAQKTLRINGRNGTSVTALSYGDVISESELRLLISSLL